MIKFEGYQNPTPLVKALKNISFSIDEEMAFVTGHSGAGKSTCSSYCFF